MGHRRDHGSADQVRQDRGDRRSGRYLIPELPKAKYKVWVRGYGLVDSAKVDGEPGKTLDLKAVPAPNEKAAAEYYPGMYWYAMINVPGTSEFPGTGDKGNGIRT